MIAVLRDLLHFSWILFDNLSCGFMRSCCDADFTAAAVISLSPGTSQVPLAPTTAPSVPSDMPAHNFVGGKLVSLMVLNVAAEWRVEGRRENGWLGGQGPRSVLCLRWSPVSFLDVRLSVLKIATKSRKRSPEIGKFLHCTFCTWQAIFKSRKSAAAVWHPLKVLQKKAKNMKTILICFAIYSSLLYLFNEYIQ